MLEKKHAYVLHSVVEGELVIGNLTELLDELWPRHDDHPSIHHRNFEELVIVLASW
jgi:hypothetical protein